MAVHHTNNPFPGLRPFTTKESDLFFGREGQSEKIADLISNHQFVTVTGASGTGKSSLVFCGVLPRLSKLNPNLKVIHIRPGNNPLKNLLDALVTENYKSREIYSLPFEKIGSLFPANATNLLIIDQFEELFRFNRSVSGPQTLDIAGWFAELIVYLANKVKNVSIVITMRSDFIGECSRFPALTNLINTSNYLVPHMIKEDYERAITGPVSYMNAEIETELVEMLIDEIGDKTDQLPVLQHALMRTWDYWKKHSQSGRPIGISDYTAIGKLESALSVHANEAYEELDDYQKIICEHMFKALTEKGKDNRGVRHPQKISSIAAISNSSANEVIAIANHFRINERSFLVPGIDKDLDENSILDISHESLMRIWERLAYWVEEEALSAQLYLRLVEASELFSKGESGLWRPPDLQLAITWKNKQNPTADWAVRYHPAYERAIVYLETSEKEYIAEEENKRLMQRKRLKFTRNFAIILGIASIISLGLMLWANDRQRAAEKQRLIAEQQTELANQQTLEAQKQQKIAEEQRKIAEDQTKIALEQTQLAEYESDRAVKNATEAEKQAMIAQRNFEEASVQRSLAQKNEEEAKRQSDIAEENSRQAIRLRMLSTSKTLALKSVQIENDHNLKALLAYIAYKFNREYRGPDFDADIYMGLYEAHKHIDSSNLKVFRAHEDAISSVIFLDYQSGFISTSYDGKIFKWNISNSIEKPLLIHTNPLGNICMAVNDKKTILACGSDGLGIQIFDLHNNNKLLYSLNAHENKIRNLIFTSEGNLISGGINNELLLWDSTFNTSRGIYTGTTRIQTLDFNPSLNNLVIGLKDGRIDLLELKSGLLSTLLHNQDQILSVAFSNSGNELAFGDIKGNLKIWDLNEKKQIATLSGHSGRIYQIKYSPDDKIIASVSFDGTVRLWDNHDLNNFPIVLTDNEGFIFSLDFSHDSKIFLTGSSEEDRLIARYTYAENLVNELLPKITRDITKDEWNTFIGPDVEFRPALDNKYRINVKAVKN